MAGGGDQDNKHNQKLQAVLLADSFLTSFQPITLDASTPKVLCPLNNVTMIDYAIEYLIGAGVEELYIFCVSGGDAVEKYIQSTRLSSSSSGTTKTKSNIQIKIVRDSSVTDVGGALRELYNKNWIQSDPFILMSGDVVTNADIGPAMKEHKERHKKDNSAIMTMLLKRTGGWDVNGHGGASDSSLSCQISPLQSLSEDLTVALSHPTTSTSSSNNNSNQNDTHSRIFLYDTNPNTTITQLPTSFFTTTSKIEVYNNMMDCGLYICSPDVLAKFSDEWDYLHIKTFISNSVAEEEEGLQTKIYAKQLTSAEYAARISDFRTYHSVSKDLLKRWCYPIVPDNLPSGYEKQYRYGVERHMMYIEQKGKTKVGKNVTLKGPGMVGSHTKINDGCIVKQCIIGNDCHIGKNTTLTSCHLWDNVIVDDDVSITQSILCNGCMVKKGAVIKKGCVVGKSCIIGENMVLPEYTRITCCEEEDVFGDDYDNDDDDNDDDDLKDVQTDHSVVGSDGFGRVWTPSNEQDDDEEEEEKEFDPVEQMKTQSIGYDPTDLLQQRMKRQIKDDVIDNVDQGMDEEEDDFDNQGIQTNLNEDGQFIFGRQADVDVVKELKLICLDYDFSSPIENLRIELNSFKFSQNATFSDCVSGTILAIIERLKISNDMTTGKLVASFKKELEAWSELLEKLCFGLDEEVSVIKAIETAATEENIVGEVLTREPSFRFMLQTLHGEDIISDEALMKWASLRREENQDSAVGKLFNQKHTQEFLEWIEEEDSSDDDSDDDSDSDDEESD